MRAGIVESMSDRDEAEATEPEHDALVQRVGLIEDQPLAERAEAYARVHAELQAHLEGSDERR